jgi:hypothetical protein
MPEFQRVDIPQGRFIGWGKQGQTITVNVISFDPTGGTDFNGNICPQMVGTLVERADNYKDKGTTHEVLDAGEMVTVSGGVANLKRGLLAADPKPGDIVRMTFSGEYSTGKGTGKTIDVEIARGAAQSSGVPVDDVV